MNKKKMEQSSIAMYSSIQDDLCYSSCCVIGQQLLKNVEETLTKCLDSILSQRSQDDVIVKADYGTADGGNVIDHMNKTIDHIRRVKGDGQEILIILDDQCLNDFNVLFQKVMGFNGVKCIREGDNIHTLISGTSMYGRCLPRNTIDLGSSTIAVHWLSKWPINIKAGMTIFEADEHELELIKHQSSVDWKHFVINRGMEMKSGAYFLVISVNDIERKTERAFRTLTKVCHGMLKDNLISQEEFHQINLPVYQIRPVEDMAMIFSDLDVSSLGLELVSTRKYEYRSVPSIDKGMITESTISDHAIQMSRFIRSWAYNVIIFGLSGNRGKEEKEAIANKYFDRFQKYLIDLKYTDGCIADIGEILFRKI